jgi:hypothetical protein
MAMQYKQHLIPARPLAAHAQPLAPEQVQLQLPQEQQRQPARAPLPRPAQLQFNKGFFWHGGFTIGEAFVDHGKDYPAFRHKAIARLKS